MPKSSVSIKSRTIADPELEHIEQCIVRAALEAGDLVKSRFGGILEVSSKGIRAGKDLVTDVDRASQNLIANIMMETCPGHMLLGEEDPPDDKPEASEWLWVVDPIDGTTNYVNSSNIYAISIAALYKGETVAAAIWIPWPNDNGFELMHARKGHGTWIGNSKLQVHPSSKTGVPITGVLASFPRWMPKAFNIKKPLMENPGEIRDGGSACYEQFMVAKGSMQYAITGFARSWDFAAGILLIKEAGGKVMCLNSHGQFSDFNGWMKNYETNSQTYAQLRKWKGLILSGTPRTVDFVAANLGSKQSHLLEKIKTLFRY